MSVINPLAREISAKIVYYGPGLSGKTSSLTHIHDGLNPAKRGELISLATEEDRTLYFDFLPIELGKVRDLTVRLQLYTVPGQVFYGATRQLVLEGADGVVFVADSQKSARERNVESLEDLENNLIELGTSLSEVPFVVQYNKRDLDDIDTVEELRELLNPYDAPDFETVANEGQGVLLALKSITRLVTQHLSGQSPSDASASSLRRALSPPPISTSGANTGFKEQVSEALNSLGGSLSNPPPPDIHKRTGAPSLPSAPQLNDLGETAPPATWAAAGEETALVEYPVTTQRPASSTRVPREHNAQTIQAPATSPLSFAAMWTDPTTVEKIEEDIAGGYFAEAVYRATVAVSEILDDLLGEHSAETSATRAQLLGLDGHEYLELRRLGSLPAATITQRDALFALYVLISAHMKARRLLV